MIEKISELAKKNPKISDFHLRSGSTLAYRQKVAHDLTNLQL